jgi:DNA repair exonuclease SbcCD ATPase subunit
MIRRLEIENFAGVEKVDLRVDSLTLIYGWNASGKTSIRNAMRYLLTGQRVAGAKFEDYIRGGSKSAVVRMEYEAEKPWTLERRRSRSAETCKINGEAVSKEQFERLMRELFGDLAVLDAVFEAAELPYLDAKERQRALLRATGNDLGSWAEIAAALGEELAEEAGTLVSSTKADDGAGIKSIDDLEEVAVQERRAMKRLLAAAEKDLGDLQAAAATGPEAGEIPRAESLLRELNGYRDKLLQRQGARSAGKSALEERRAEADSKLRGVHAAIREVTRMDCAAMESQAKALDQKLHSLEGRRVDVRGAGLEADAAAKAARERAETADNWTNECPAFPGGICTSRPFTDEQADDYRREAAEKHEAALERGDEFQALCDEIDSLAGEREAVLRGLSDCRQQAARRRELEEAESRLAREVTDLDARIRDAGDDPGVDLDAELRKVDERIENGRKFLQSAKARRDAASKLAEAEAAVQRIEDAVRVADDVATQLGKDGEARMKLLRGALGGVVESMAKYVDALMGEEYALDSAALVERGEFGISRRGAALHPAFWSRSERVRIGFAIQYALATEACSSRLAVFDEVDTLDRPGRRAMAETLFDAMERFANVFALSTITEGDFVPPTAGDGVAVYVIEAGSVKGD